MNSGNLIYILVPAIPSVLSIVFLISAIRISYVIEGIKAPDRHGGPRMTFTNLFASAFGPAPTPQLNALRGALRFRLILSLMLLVAGAALSQIVRLEYLGA